MVVRTSITDSNTKEIVSDMTYTVPGNSILSIADVCKEWLMDFKYTFRVSVGVENAYMAAAVTDWTETKEIIIGDE